MFKNNKSIEENMQYYSVVNTLTGELQTVNGEVARYHTFYAARVERISLNDLSGGYDHYTKQNSRTTYWQVIVAPAPESIKAVTENVDKQLTSGVWIRKEETKFYLKSAQGIVPIKRAPEKLKANKQMAAYQRALFSHSVKNTKCRVRRKK